MGERGGKSNRKTFEYTNETYFDYIYVIGLRLRSNIEFNNNKCYTKSSDKIKKQKL